MAFLKVKTSTLKLSTSISHSGTKFNILGQMFKINFQILLWFELSNSVDKPVRKPISLTGFLSGVIKKLFFRKEPITNAKN